MALTGLPGRQAHKVLSERRVHPVPSLPALPVPKVLPGRWECKAKSARRAPRALSSQVVLAKSGLPVLPAFRVRRVNRAFRVRASLVPQAPWVVQVPQVHRD